REREGRLLEDLSASGLLAIGAVDMRRARAAEREAMHLRPEALEARDLATDEGMAHRRVLVGQVSEAERHTLWYVPPRGSVSSRGSSRNHGERPVRARPSPLGVAYSRNPRPRCPKRLLMRSLFLVLAVLAG